MTGRIGKMMDDFYRMKGELSQMTDDIYPMTGCKCRVADNLLACQMVRGTVEFR